ncbi:MAG: BolA family transcriptional regulator [Proteobacteria bacterium]|nr:BolA family transcriptional regulator [Pseudomonadota bacterium]NBX86562.1 BolA family transcriptional regulator [Pseudomonadota bacterium]
MPQLTASQLEQIVTTALPGAVVTVRDDTHKHLEHNHDVNHHGGHYLITVTWSGFANMARMARHRKVMALFQEAWQQGQIHSLSLRLKTPA